MPQDEFIKDLRLEAESIIAIIKGGYAGVMPGTGIIVDRREHPEAIPVQENQVMGTPRPKAVENDKFIKLPEGGEGEKEGV